MTRSQPVSGVVSSRVGCFYLGGHEETREGTLVQIAFGAEGINLPRDSNQQVYLGALVATRWYRQGLRRGDVLYFLGRHGKIRHTGIYLGDGNYIESVRPTVRITSFDPEDESYDARRDASFVFAKLNEAYGTLSDKRSREIYLKTAPLQPGEKRRTDPEGALVAYEKAKVFINKKMNPKALEQLRLAHELDPSVAEYHARYLWWDFLCNPKESRVEKLPKTKNALLKMFNDVPGNFYVNRCLAQVFLLLKDDENYERHLNKAAAIRPTDIDTVRELRLHNSRKQKSQKRGLFSGITLTRKK